MDGAINATNVTTAVVEEGEITAALIAACQLWQPAAYVYTSVLPFWLAMFAYWVALVWRYHVADALDLHRMLTWIPAIEKIFGATWVIVTILKEPVMLVCLLLVAKGWCITRQRLNSQEVAHSACLVTAL